MNIIDYQSDHFRVATDELCLGVECSTAFSSQLLLTAWKSREVYARVRSHLEKQRNKQKSHYDTKVYGKAYKKGDLVLLHCPAVPKGRSRKLHRPWQGPYVIVKVIGEAVYKIKLLSNTNPQHRKVVH